MDKLKRVLSGNDDTPNDENRGIMGDVCWIHLCIINKFKYKKKIEFRDNLPFR